MEVQDLWYHILLTSKLISIYRVDCVVLHNFYVLFIWLEILVLSTWLLTSSMWDFIASGMHLFASIYHLFSPSHIKSLYIIYLCLICSVYNIFYFDLQAVLVYIQIEWGLSYCWGFPSHKQQCAHHHNIFKPGLCVWCGGQTIGQMVKATYFHSA